MLIQATTSSCLDYYSSFLIGVPASTVFSLWSFSITARVILIKYVTSYSFTLNSSVASLLAQIKGQIPYKWSMRPHMIWLSSPYPATYFTLSSLPFPLFLPPFLFFIYTKHASTSEPLNFLIFLPRLFFHLILPWLVPSLFQVLFQMSSFQCSIPWLFSWIFSNPFPALLLYSTVPITI